MWTMVTTVSPFLTTLYEQCLHSLLFDTSGAGIYPGKWASKSWLWDFRAESPEAANHWQATGATQAITHLRQLNAFQSSYMPMVHQPRCFHLFCLIRQGMCESLTDDLLGCESWLRSLMCNVAFWDFQQKGKSQLYTKLQTNCCATLFLQQDIQV